MTAGVNCYGVVTEGSHGNRPLFAHCRGNGDPAEREQDEEQDVVDSGARMWLAVMLTMEALGVVLGVSWLVAG
jgi:hypothetical protein